MFEKLLLTRGRKRERGREKDREVASKTDECKVGEGG